MCPHVLRREHRRHSISQKLWRQFDLGSLQVEGSLVGCKNFFDPVPKRHTSALLSPRSESVRHSILSNTQVHAL